MAGSGACAEDSVLLDYVLAEQLLGRQTATSVTGASGHPDAAAAAEFLASGACILRRALPATVVERAREEVALSARAVDQARRRTPGGELGAVHELRRADGVEFFCRERTPRRVDLLMLSLAHRPGFEAVHELSHAAPLVRELIGSDAFVAAVGCFLAEPGALGGDYHTDGPHLFGRPGRAAASRADEEWAGVPPYALHAFVPLVDAGKENGMTEYLPSTHTVPRPADVPTHKGITPELRAGDCLLIDYRTLHRTRPNTSGTARPMLYTTWCAPWFNELCFRDWPERAYEPFRNLRSWARNEHRFGGSVVRLCEDEDEDEDEDEESEPLEAYMGDVRVRPGLYDARGVPLRPAPSYAGLECEEQSSDATDSDSGGGSRSSVE